jgi:hypothetical protein
MPQGFPFGPAVFATTPRLGKSQSIWPYLVITGKFMQMIVNFRVVSYSDDVIM